MSYYSPKPTSILTALDINSVLFLDIETVPSAPSFNELPEVFKNLWLQKAKKYSKEELTPEELFFEKAALHAEFAKIVCISVGYYKISKKTSEPQVKLRSFYGHDEAELLANFKQLLESHYNDHLKHFLCAHNGIEFDYPFLARRMMINGIRLPNLLNVSGSKSWNNKWLLDTMELWRFGNNIDKTSLDLLAACFDIVSPKDDISGKDVARVYYFEDGLERIRIYCEKDVRTLIELFTKMAFVRPVIDEPAAEIEKSDITISEGD